YYHAVLSLEPAPHLESANVKAMLRPLCDDDWGDLASVFADAFRDQPPLGHLGEEGRINAAANCLGHTRDGGDGPLIGQACHVAVDTDDSLRGAILITLFPEGDPSSVASYQWADPPPADAVERRLGRPHLTWVFVGHDIKGRGLGAALLRAAVGTLREMGYRELATTFLLGNSSSLLWHWRMGVRLVAYPFSGRAGWRV